MKYLTGDLLLKVFHALLLFIYQSNSLNSYYVVKKGATLTTIKYHFKHVQWNGFDGDYSIPTLKGLNKKLRDTAMTTTQAQSHIPTEILKKGLFIGKTVLATIKCHWIDVQWKLFDGGLSITIVQGLNKKLKCTA